MADMMYAGPQIGTNTPRKNKKSINAIIAKIVNISLISTK